MMAFAYFKFTLRATKFELRTKRMCTPVMFVQVSTLYIFGDFHTLWSVYVHE